MKTHAATEIKTVSFVSQQPKNSSGCIGERVVKVLRSGIKFACEHPFETIALIGMLYLVSMAMAADVSSQVTGNARTEMTFECCYWDLNYIQDARYGQNCNSLFIEGDGSTINSLFVPFTEQKFSLSQRDWGQWNCQVFGQLMEWMKDHGTDFTGFELQPYQGSSSSSSAAVLVQNPQQVMAAVVASLVFSVAFGKFL